LQSPPVTSPPLDTIAHYETPEGVELSFAVAGPVVRAAAWGIDLAVRLVGYFLLALLTALLGGVGTSLMLIGIFLLEWFYPVFFEVHNGMTPGKKALGLQVVHDDGTPLAWSSALLRNLLRSVDFLPFLNMAGLVTMLLNPQFKRLGDLAAGTLVVYVNDEVKEFKIPDHPPLPPPEPIRISEQRIILNFCERADRLSRERCRELAALLASLTGTDVPVRRLMAFGNWFLKGKGGS